MRTIDHDPVVVATKLLKSSRLRPTLAIVLGTGYGSLTHALEVDAEVPYSELPGFPSTGVSGHAGKVFIGRIEGVPVMVLSGRAHFYEGHDLVKLTFPIRALSAYSISDLLLTNAAGGVNPRFKVGDLMILRDHINLMGANPLRGVSRASHLTQFVDLTRAYNVELCALLQKAAKASGLRLRSGVYLAVCGPSYETPAEIRAFSRLGADSVGMSTVPEVIVARQCGMRVAALSCITNLAAGLARRPLSHTEVLETAAKVEAKTQRLLQSFVSLYPAHHSSGKNSH